MALRPDVPYSPVQSVLPQTQSPDDYVRVQAQPTDFGAQIGAAQEQAGKTVEQLGGQASDLASQFAEIHNRVAADQGTNALMQKAQQRQFGDPNDPNDHGYFGKRGQDALDARAPTINGLTADAAQIRAGLANDRQRLYFDETSRRILYSISNEINSHADQQWGQWADQQQSGLQSSSLQGLGSNPNSDAAFQLNLDQGMKATAARSTLAGESPEASRAALLDYQSKAYATRAIAMASSDPVSALSFLTTNQGKMDGPTYARLEETLAPKARVVTASKLVGGDIPMPGVVTLGPAATAVQNAATTIGMDPVQAQTVAQIESSGGAQPDRLGSKYKGVFQLGDDEFFRNGGVTRGNVDDEAKAGVANLANLQGPADQAVGGRAEPWQVYLFHQQGPAGAAALFKADPSQNVVDALAPAYSGDRATAAAAVKQNFGDPAGTVGRFLSTWQNKYEATEQRVRGAMMGHMQYPDVAGLEQKVIDQTAGDPELQKEALAQLHQRLSLMNVQAEQAKQELSHTISGTNAALLAGDTSVSIPETTIRTAYPGPEADRIVADLDASKQAGLLIKSLKWATPDQVHTVMADLSTPDGKIGTTLRADATGGVQDANALPPETPDQTLRRQQIFALAKEKLDARDKALASDPASYVADEPNVATAMSAINANDPSSFEAYARVSRAAQKALGVADADQRVLAVGTAQSMTKSLLTADPTKVDAGTQLDEMAKQYGQEWPNVWHDIVRDGHMPPDWQVLGMMDAPGQGVARIDLQRALQAVRDKGGADALRKGLATKDATQVDDDVETGMADFRKTMAIPGVALNADVIGAVRSAARTLAYSYALQGVDNPAQKAVDGILGQKYDFDGYLRTPKGMSAQVESAMYGMLGNLKASDLAPQPGSATLTQDDRNNIVLRGLNRRPVFLTNERDDGAYLAAQTPQGIFIPTRPDGSRFELKFSDVAAGKAPSAPMQTLNDPAG